MIKYRLVCANGHEFEGWFRNIAAYEAQADGGEVSCPLCGDKRVQRAVMAPAVKGTRTQDEAQPARAVDPTKFRQFAAGFRKVIRDNAEYVGPRFPEEARKIHYGEIEERRIYGETTLSEAKDLIEEGIDIAPIPPDPDSLN